MDAKTEKLEVLRMLDSAYWIEEEKTFNLKIINKYSELCDGVPASDDILDIFLTKKRQYKTSKYIGVINSFFAAALYLGSAASLLEKKLDLQTNSVLDAVLWGSLAFQAYRVLKGQENAREEITEKYGKMVCESLDNYMKEKKPSELKPRLRNLVYCLKVR